MWIISLILYTSILCVAVRQAKLIAVSVGGVLVVGVHTDAEIERNKGPPVMRDAERCGLTAAR